MSYDKTRSPDDELDRARAAFEAGDGGETERSLKAVLIHIHNVSPDNFASVETKLLELLQLIKIKRAEILDAQPTSHDRAR